MGFKEYRIIRTDPEPAVVNVKHKEKDYPYVGYTSMKAAVRDRDRLEATYPGMWFLIAEYVELEC